MKKYFLLLSLICMQSKATILEPLITMTTAKSLGENISFALAASVDNTIIQIDFGDGNKVDKTIGTQIQNINGTISGSQTIKIYGEKILFLDCKDNLLTALDVTKSTILTKLLCYNNLLTELDITNNIALTHLWCDNNQLSILDVTKNTALTKLSCDKNKLTNLDVTENLALEVLSFYKNQLIALDITKNITLTYLCCDFNMLTTLDVTKNIMLKDLFCSNNLLTEIDVTKNVSLWQLLCFNNLITTLDVTNNRALKHLRFFNNRLTSLNISSNPALTTLWCSNNQLSTMDVTNNTSLIDLFCEENQLTSLDVSKNSALTRLSCSNNQLTVLDVTNNTLLEVLGCDKNKLSNLDVSKNMELISLFCSSNQLMALDLTNNKMLSELNCYNNRLTFATLILRNFDKYYYAPQQEIAIEASYRINDLIDLSSQLIINGNTTEYIWKTESGSMLDSGTDYIINDGITTFIKVPTEKIYCEMRNTTYPDFNWNQVLKTTLTSIGSATRSVDIPVDNIDAYTKNKTVYVSFPEIADVQVYDINGHLMKMQRYDKGNYNFELVQKGIYIMKIGTRNQNVSKKVVIK